MEIKRYNFKVPKEKYIGLINKIKSLIKPYSLVRVDGGFIVVGEIEHHYFINTVYAFQWTQELDSVYRTLTKTDINFMCQNSNKYMRIIDTASHNIGDSDKIEIEFDIEANCKFDFIKIFISLFDMNYLPPIDTWKEVVYENKIPSL